VPSADRPSPTLSRSRSRSARGHPVDAADLLINSVPATRVTGRVPTTPSLSRNPPMPGGRHWATNHAIADTEVPRISLRRRCGRHLAIRADRRNPASVAGQAPWRGDGDELTQLTVLFTESVRGVDAWDLLINGAPATGLSGRGQLHLSVCATQRIGNQRDWATNTGSRIWRLCPMRLTPARRARAGPMRP